MQVDTGAAITLISEDTYCQFFKDISLKDYADTLTTYTGEQIQVHGYAEVDVKYGDQSASLQLVVVSGSGPSLLGRNWLSQIRLDWSRICNIQCGSIEDILSKYPEVFREGLSAYKGPAVWLFVDKDAQPHSLKLALVPISSKVGCRKQC